MYPVVLDFENSHGKKFVHRCPFHFREFSAGSLSEVGLVIFDDSAFIFLGGERCVDPVAVSVQILHLLPALLGF